MRINSVKSILKTAVHVATVLLLGAGVAGAQQQVNLTAGYVTTTMPDGSSVPMWGYSCGAVVSGSTATCAAANKNAGGNWSPVIITVASGQDLQINLTNNLSFTPTGSSTANNIPTSIVIVGQLGGGLGTSATSTPSPTHDNQGATWPIANGAIFTPPTQGSRVQSFAKEVNVGDGAPALTWTAPRPGTYLLESGTHPSIQATMGLIGMVVVTTAPTSSTAGTAYPTGGTGAAVNYSADVPLLFSEIDPAQNRAVDAAVRTVGFLEGATYGTYLGGPVTSLALTNPGSGYTTAPSVTFTGGLIGGTAPAHPALGHTVIDTTAGSPTLGQVIEIDIDDPGAGYVIAPTVTLSAAPTGTGNVTATANAALQLQPNGLAHCQSKGGTVPACYPPVVNYTPLYYLINGVAFNKTSGSGSLFAAMPGTTATPVTGNVLVRFVNAGVRMHIPSIVGSTTGTPAVGGFSLIAEDGNPLPGIPRVQNEVFMAPGKTYDVMINVPASTSTALPVFDRQLSLSGNATARDSGMLAYISVNGAGMPVSPGLGKATANPDTYNAVIAGQTLVVSDPGKGVIANDVNVFGVQVTTPPTQGTLTLNVDGTFQYAASNSWSVSDSFKYCGNGATSGSACATVSLGAETIEGASGITCGNSSFTSSLAHSLKISAPGVLSGCKDAAGYPLKVDTATITPVSGLTLQVDSTGAFTATVGGTGAYTFTFKAQNSQGTDVATAATVTLNFPAPSGLNVTVLDGADRKTPITDYRWIIEEDRTFFSDPKCTGNPPPAGCPALPSGAVPNFGTNFHTSYMPVIATGCTGSNSCAANQTVGGVTVPTPITTMPSEVAVCPTSPTTPPTTNCLDPNKRYYISVLPGDAAQPFIAGYAGAPDCSAAGVAAGSCGHGMGGAPIAKGQQSVTVYSVPSPYPPATLSVFVFEDDFPLNGEHDAGGGVDVLSPNEPGLGGFQILLADDAGGTGDSTGQPTYDMFNMPLSNSLAGTIDPVTGNDACPISTQVTKTSQSGDSSQNGIVGMIITCPTYESDGKTLSPLAGQAVVKNLYQGRYGVIANPGADRIARGEEWLQTNTLDGQKAHDSFMRIGEPGYFQEFGPAGYHVTIGFANPKIINNRRTAMCTPASGSTANPCPGEVKGHITTARMSRTPDERLYGSGTHDSYSFTQCYVSIGDPDGADFGFAKCDDQGNFDFTGVPPGNWKVTTFDQWNDQVVDGITTPVIVANSSTPVDMGEMAVHQWQANIYTRTFIDVNGDGVSNKDGQGNDLEPGLALAPTNIRFRDGSFSNFNNTDLNGYAGFNEVFPLFNWYTIETDSTRFKNTGTHVVYDSGGPVDGSSPNGTACAGLPLNPSSPSKPCGNSTIAQNLANTFEPNPLPPDLSVPGAVYCTNADCSGFSIANAITAANTLAFPSTTDNHSTGRIDPAWVTSYGWQGYSGQNSFLEFGKKPFAPTENGGIHGHVVYASTRPFDDPRLLLQLSWEPLVPHVRINLYQEGLANDGVTKTLTLVDHTETSSFDDWAQGFRTVNTGIGSIAVTNGGSGYTTPPTVTITGTGSGAAATAVVNSTGAVTAINLTSDGTGYTGTPTVTIAGVGSGATAVASVPAGGVGIPNMSCPGQGTDSTLMADPYFWFALKDQPQWLDLYNSTNGAPTHPLAYESQYKCYDGMHNWNQLQPAPYDGMYSFPSVTSINPVTGNTAGTNCTICTKNPDPTDPFRYNKENMLPAGKYVVEVVVPPGFELVKEEDKNILIGDNYIAPVTQQFGGLGSIFIMPDQASVMSGYNPNNPQNPTSDLGRTTLPSHEADTGSLESFWPCVGAERVVPDYISLFPGSAEVAPFAGATRNLCDRKEVTLDNQTSALAKFYIFTETHTASHFTGVITDDFTAEFDPFSPQFGEKYGPAYLPISFKDWAGNEIERVYTDAWGAYNGLSYSTWEVNPPNPTGYGPTMMVGCMNDAGPVLDTNTASPTYGKMISDPLFQDGYSQFCYELPFMPGQTGYFDTPVVPTSAFAGGYNNPDCAYPDATPAVGEVDGDQSTTVAGGGIGPWVSAAGHTITIHALGDQLVDNYAYSGPSATAAPYNQQKVKRHYGFGPAPSGAGCSGGNPNAACPNVTVGGIPLHGVNWSDTQITGTVQSNVPPCAVQQQAQYGGSQALCGQLVITAVNGNQSVDAVTVTIGGKAPTRVSGNTPLTSTSSGSIQQAIDNANPGDLIIVPPGTYSEMVLMWKPVRLQGVGAASSIIDANTQPAGKLDPWRRQVVCLFGLALNGQPYTSASGSNPFDSSGTFSCPGTMKNFSGGPDYPTMVVDRIPMEGILGWDTTVNGNLAEQLIEPSLMGAYEGAGITVLGKGVKIPAGATDVFGSGSESAFPAGSVPLTASDCTTGSSGTNLYPSNFLCNPSGIDGLTVKNSSQGGGGILVHAWGHGLQIANNRVTNNQGTLSGGITIGQGEHPDVPLVGGGVATVPPGSCITSTGSAPTNLALPYCYDMDVNVHNNLVTQNSSLGDELFSSTPTGAGGVTFCNGSDYYKFNYNWVCGNMSTGDGAGVAHIGFSYDGDIENNTIMFNQSTNPTIVTNGGGLLVMGAPDPDPPCSTTDQDCVSPPGSITPSDGTGPGLVINANLILGNSADSGSGGGLRLQHINGTDVLNFPKGNTATAWPIITGHVAQPAFQKATPWNAMSVTNNIIANNVAGWDGGGISLQDALATDVVNNTVVSNTSTAASGVLFQSLFAPLASTQGTNCSVNNGAHSCPQVAGLVSVTNSAVLTANMNLITPGGTGAITCPTGHGTKGSNSDCTKFSVPAMTSDLFWQNRSLMISVGSPTSGFTNQQNTVTVYDTGFGPAVAPAAAQTATGSCNDANASYWDIGVRGDKFPGDHTAGWLAPNYSVLTNPSGTYGEVGAGTNDLLAPGSTVVSGYCDGSRVPVEAASSLEFAGWQVPPGTNESNALPAPPFTLLASATVDEGNNWVNLRWGPLSINVPTASGTPAFTFNPSPAAGATLIDFVPTTVAHPALDFYGRPRPDAAVANKFDIGAIEYTGPAVPAPTLTSITPNYGRRSSTVAVTLTGTHLTGTTAVTVSGTGVTASGITVVNDTTVTANFAITSTATISARTVTVTTSGGTSGPVTFTVAAPTLTSITPNSGLRGTSVPVTLTGTGLTGSTSMTVSGTGITVTNLVIVNDSQATATLVITAAAGTGARNVAIVTPGGTTNNVTFTVVAPTLASIAPTTGARGTSVNVTLTGTGLTGASNVTVSGTGVTVSSVTAVNDTTVTATFTITLAAGLTSRNVAVVTPGGTTNAVLFTITAAATPTLTSVSPNAGVRGTTVPVTLTGTNLTGATAVTVSSTGVTASGITVVNSTTVTANFAITTAAGLTARSVTITTPLGTSPALSGAFTVQGATLTSISPTTGTHGTTVPVTLTGNNLSGATAVTIAGGGVTCTGITSTATTVNASCAITAGATQSARNVTVTTPIGVTPALTGAFTVQ